MKLKQYPISLTNKVNSQLKKGSNIWSKQTPLLQAEMSLFLHFGLWEIVLHIASECIVANFIFTGKPHLNLYTSGDVSESNHF